MDGLECSEIRMSDVCDTTTLRFDSDYYKKEYLEIEQFICKNRDKFVTIESQGLQVDASAFYPSLEPYYNTGTIPFVRVADVKVQNSFALRRQSKQLLEYAKQAVEMAIEQGEDSLL